MVLWASPPRRGGVFSPGCACQRCNYNKRCKFKCEIDTTVQTFLKQLQRASITIRSTCDVLQLLSEVAATCSIYHLKQLQRASGSIWMLNHLQRAFSGSSVATWHKCRWLLTVGAAATCFRWFPKRPCWIIAIRGSCTKHSQTLRCCVVILTSLTAIPFSWLRQ